MAEAIRLTDYEDPDEGLDAKEIAAHQERLRVLDQLGSMMAERRSAAMSERYQLGIEEVWLEDEEMYAGVDEHNAAEVGRAIWRKGSIEQPAQRRQTATKSTIFINLTRPYCDAAAARVSDMLLPTDDRAFSVSPTPVVDLLEMSQGNVPAYIEGRIRGALPDEEAYQIARTQAIASAKAKHDKAKTEADKVQAIIDDWLTEGHYHKEAREVIHDVMKAGVGVLKQPVPREVTRVAWRDGGTVVDTAIKPVSVRVDYWNCYPGAGGGSDPQTADSHFERDFISRRGLMDLIGKEGYFDYAIESCLAEGPKAASRDFDRSEERLELAGLTKGSSDGRYELWYVHSTITRAQMASIEIELGGLDAAAPGAKPRAYYPVVLEMVNNHVIKATLSLLESGKFPYDYMVYQKIPGCPWGFGVARHVRAAQRMLNAAVRNMMDNAGLAGGPMWWVHRKMLQPIDGNWSLAPRKGFFANEQAPLQDLDKAIGFVRMPSMQPELEKIILLALRFAEEATGLPMLLQGQQGDATKTLGGMQILNNNGSTVLRRLAKLYDDLVTEPGIGRYHEWMLLHHPDDSLKGQYVIDARGSSALVERELQAQTLTEVYNISMDPATGLDKKRVAEMLVKSRRLHYDDLKFVDEDWRQVVEGLQAAGQKSDVRLEVAKLVAEARAIEGDKDRAMEQAMAALKIQREEEESQMIQAIKALDMQQDERTLTSEERRFQEDLKVQIGKEVMRIRAQYDLSGRGASAPQVATPPTEPAGRAPGGQAFQA